MCPSLRCGFTLIELLVVVAIVGLLIAVSLPAVQHVRETSRKTDCANRLHQLGVAIQHHESSFGTLPKDGENDWGVLTFLLPQLEQKPLYDSLTPKITKRDSVPSASQGLLGTEIAALSCPSFRNVAAPAANGGGRTTYLGPSGLFTKRMTLSDVVDGESQTIAFGETRGDHAWAWPGLGTGRGEGSGTFGSNHPGGLQVVLCDGATRFLSESLDAGTFEALCTPQGREVVGEF